MRQDYNTKRREKYVTDPEYLAKCIAMAKEAYLRTVEARKEYARNRHQEKYSAYAKCKLPEGEAEIAGMPSGQQIQQPS